MRNDELMHYGVLGMKWGHRKQRPRLSDDERAARRRKIAKGAAAIAGTAAIGAGTYYLQKHGKNILYKHMPKRSTHISRSKKMSNINRSKHNIKNGIQYKLNRQEMVNLAPKVDKSVFRNSKGKKVYPKRTQRPKTYYYKNGKPVRKPLKMYADEFGNMSPKIKIKKRKNPYLKKRPHVIMAGPDIKTGTVYKKKTKI